MIPNIALTGDDPGARSRSLSEGRPRNSPMNPEALNTGDDHLSSMAAAQPLKAGRGYKKQDVLAQRHVSSRLWCADCSRSPGDR